MKKRILSILLVITIVTTMFPLYSVTSFAEACVPEEHFEYVVISETEKTAKITGYTCIEEEIDILSTVFGYTIIAIGEGTFSDFTHIISVTIPDTVTSIENGAFSGCTSLADVYYSGSIDQWNEITIAENNDDLLNATLHTNDEINLEDWNYYIDYDIGEVTIYNYYGDSANVVIPSTIEGYPVTTIGATEAWHHFTSVTIPDSITSIEIAWAFFRWSTELTTINVSAENSEYSSVDGVLFNKDKTALLYYPMAKTDVTYTVPETVVTIGAESFSDYLGYDSWYLQNIVLPEGVKTIENYAFNNCDTLTTVVIPESLQTIGVSAFSGNSALTDIFYVGTLDQWNEISIADDNSSLSNATLHTDYVLGGEESDNTDFEYSVIDANAKTAKITGYIGNNTELTIPSEINGYTIIEIGNYAFYDLFDEINITDIVIPNSITVIGDYAFYYCNNLESVSIPDSVTKIGSEAFCGCKNLKSLSIGKGLSEISASMFYVDADDIDEKIVYSASLTSIKVSSENPYLTSINDVVFTEDEKELLIYPRCKDEASYTIPDTVTTIGDFAFSGGNFEKVIIPNSVQVIGNSAFLNCLVDELIIPNSVRTIGDYAFYSSYYLSEVGTDGLLELTIPANVSSIGSKFYGLYYCDMKMKRQFKGYSGTYAETYANENGHEFISLGSIPTSITGLYKLGETWCYVKDGAVDYNYNGVCSDNNGNIVLISQGCADTTFSGEIEYNGKVYYLKNGVVDTEYNTADFKYYVENGDAVLWSYSGTATDLVIPSTIDGYKVVKLGESLFYNDDNLLCVTIPDGVEVIEISVFSDCSNLNSVVIPDSVTDIGECVFEGCTSLADVYYSGTLNQWNEISIDSGNDELTYATLHTNDAVIEPSVDVLFEYSVIDENAKTAKITGYTGNDTELVIPSTIDGYTIVEIGEQSFYNNEHLTSVTVPEGVVKIGHYAFNRCTNLAQINLPNSIETIENRNPDLYGSGAFFGTAYVNNSSNWINGVCYMGNHVYAARATNDVIEFREGTLSVADGWYVAKKVYFPKSIRNIGDYTWFHYYDESAEKYASPVFYGYKDTCAETYAADRELIFIERNLISTDYTGLAKSNGKWYYVEDGVVDNSFTGLCKYGKSWYYVNKGVVDKSYTGLAKRNGKWYHVSKGVVDFDYTGLSKYGTKWYYVNDGRLDKTYTGLCKYLGKWYYVEDGVVDKTYTGLCKHSGKWYYVKKGVVDFTYTGLCKRGTKWYYVDDGKVNFNYKGLCKYSGKWYYVNKGVVDKSYTGYTTYNGKKYKVVKGVKV